MDTWTTITSSFLILCNLSLDRWQQRGARNVTRSTPYHGLVIYLNTSYTTLPETWKNNENGKEICPEKTVSSSWASASLKRKGDSWGRKPSACYIDRETTEKRVFCLLGCSSTEFGIGKQRAQSML